MHVLLVLRVQPYKGWELADDEFLDTPPKKARVVFYIMVSGWKELAGLDAVLRALYHRDHFFLLHMDVKVLFVLLILLLVRICFLCGDH